ncbi:MAG: hypothetical protein ACFBSE_08130, partial [Prochloraceae cyanobacterium]
IIFGPNARLNIGGSFFASTADNIKFGNNGVFSASRKNSPPVTFTQNFPDGLGFGSDPNPIVFNGNGNKLEDIIQLTPVIGRNISTGLKVKPGQTLGIAAGNIILNGATLRAEGGRIEIIGAKRQEIVDFNAENRGFIINSGNIAPRGNVQLLNESLVDVSSPELPTISNLNSGHVKIEARNLNLNNGSIILSQNRGNGNSGNITINTSDSFTIEGYSTNQLIRSGLLVEGLGNGKNADILVSSPHVIIKDGNISSSNYNNGLGGTISISSQLLELLNGGAIGTATTSTLINKKGGDIFIKNLDDIILEGISPINGASSLILTASTGFVDGGNVNIDTNNLVIKDGGNIGSVQRIDLNGNTGNTGRGGDIFINANNSIQISGIQPLSSIPSSINSNSFPGGRRGGNIAINTSQLTITNNGAIVLSTFGSGDAGKLEINAKDFVTLEDNASITSSAENLNEILSNLFGLRLEVTGNSGEIIINTPNLRLRNNSAITVRNQGSGNAGFLSFNINNFSLDNNSSITAISDSRLGGGITIQGYQPNTPAKNILLNNNSRIQTNNNTTTDRSRASIEIYTEQLNLNNNSTISANVTDTGENPLDPNLNLVGGNIDIRTTGNIRIDNNSSLSAAVQNRPGGAIDGGNIRISGGGSLFLGNNIPGNPAITASVNELGNGGDININFPNGLVVAINGADIVANAERGNGGNINIKALSILKTPEVRFSASSNTGLDGTVEVESFTAPQVLPFIKEVTFEEYNQSLRKACLNRSDMRKDKGNSIVGEEVMSRQESFEGGETFFLQINVTATQQESKTLEDYRLNQANAVITTPDGRAYLGKACLIRVSN